jgi:hypothetical protein
VGFPTKPTWITAIKNKQFASWPGLTTKAVAKHFPELEETTKGHGRKIRSSLQSTKKTAGDENNDNNNTNDESNKHDPPPCPTKKTRKIYYKIYDLEDEAQLKMCTNLTGQFLKKSSHGRQYIMVLIELDSNAIIVEAMKNRMSGEILRAYQVLVDRLRSAGIQPKLHLLDNE